VQRCQEGLPRGHGVSTAAGGWEADACLEKNDCQCLHLPKLVCWPLWRERRGRGG
jgi:hypothetical protein